MINPETIIALATPPGIGAISIIRISGKNAVTISEKLFFSSKKKKISDLKSHTVHLGKIKNFKVAYLEEISSKSMKIKYDDNYAIINFKTPISEEEIHSTLISMIREIK